MGFFVKNRRLQSGSTSIVVPRGDTVHRPEYPVAGQMRYNFDLCKMEYFNGQSFRTIAAEGRVGIEIDSFDGDGSTMVFGPMANVVDDQTGILVFVGGLYQIPGISFTVAGDMITFTSAIPNGITVNVIHNMDSTITAGCPVPSPEVPPLDGIIWARVPAVDIESFASPDMVLETDVDGYKSIAHANIYYEQQWLIAIPYGPMADSATWDVDWTMPALPDGSTWDGITIINRGSILEIVIASGEIPDTWEATLAAHAIVNGNTYKTAFLTFYETNRDLYGAQ